MIGTKKNVIVVCGPTASGKTTLGVAVAQWFDGEIVSADSRQVYRTMDIGTGKDLCEYCTDGCLIPYHLIDIADPAEVYTLYNYKNDFERVYKNIQSRQKTPVITGGTGLYIEAILRNYEIPSIPEDPELRGELMEKEKEWLEKELQTQAIDIYNKTDLSSKKRIVRALEIAIHRVKEPKSPKETSPVLDPVILCTRWNRQELWKRIDSRLEARLAQGLVKEVKDLLNSGIPRSRFALFGMEYKHVAQFIDGEVSYKTMVGNLKISIHQLAKRQETWFRGMEKRGHTICWVDNASKEIAFSILENMARTDARPCVSTIRH
jgi:tRNA dimethylallyltransferase